MLSVPFLDLAAQYRSIKTEIDSAIAQVIENSAFVRGEFVADFEKAYAELHGVRHCISVANGTDALAIALRAAGVGAGDEVITAANSWIASAEAATMAGAAPRFVDVDSTTFNMDPEHLAARITPRTRAIVPVHLFGHPAPMAEIRSLAEEQDLVIVEDCAQAHLAETDNEMVGTLGDAAGFSFYPGKNLGAYGDAGCILTDDDQLARKARMYANHGSSPEDKHDHPIEGVNSRLDGLQASILSAKLPYLDAWTKQRREKARLYTELLEGVGDIVTPSIRSNVSHVFHIYCIRTQHRNALQAHLSTHGVSTSIHYPVAIPLLGAFAHEGYSEADFPVAARLQGEILSLPIYSELTDEAIGYVTSCVKDFFSTTAT